MKVESFTDCDDFFLFCFQDKSEMCCKKFDRLLVSKVKFNFRMYQRIKNYLIMQFSQVGLVQ